MKERPVKPTTYLASLGSARALYIWLYEDAVAMLPPGGGEHDIASHSSLASAATALEWGQGLVRKELARLVSFGWVRSKRLPRFLGRRADGTHLIADLAAEDATGKAGVVSRMVLHLKDTDKQEPTIKLDLRGTNRRWNRGDMTGEW